MINLDVRLNAAYSLCDRCELFADIGSDHGKLPVALLLNGVVNRALITDINQKPLNNSMKCAMSSNVMDKCEFFLGNGLEPLEGRKIDVIAICGMGGRLIAQILERGSAVSREAKSLILQPMSAYEELVEYLDEAGYEIQEELIVSDKHLFYHLYKVAWKNSLPKTSDIYSRLFSDRLIDKSDPVMRLYLEYRLEVAMKISDNRKKMNSPKDSDSTGELIRQIQKRLVRYENR